MAEIQNYVFSHKEVAEALVKHQGINEGIWGIYVEFGIQGANITSGPTGENLLPAAIVPIVKIGIQRFEKVNQLSIDAAVVNPAPKPKSKQTGTH